MISVGIRLWARVRGTIQICKIRTVFRDFQDTKNF